MNRIARLAAILLVLVGCSRSAGVEEPVWGKQTCAHCSMVVSDKRYAAQVLTGDGSRLFFDDIGCMVEHRGAKHAVGDRIWVRVESRDAWVDGEKARFHRGAKTPMDYGIAADDEGQLSFEEMRQEVLTHRRGS
jgi:copper chaperone NosL